MNPPAQSDYLRAANLLQEWKRPVLISHAKPDGDAIGSVLGVDALLSAGGARPTPLLFEPLPPRLTPAAEGGSYAIGNAAEAQDIIADADSVVILDTCSFSQLDPIAEWLKKTSLPKLVIDHHSTRDPVAPNLLIDESAAATCLILFELAKAAGWNVDLAAAKYLFVGIATDTGWFRHSNTDARALRAAGELAALGVKPYQLFEALYQQDTEGRVRLLSEALQTMELHCSHRLALMRLRREAFGRAAAGVADTEDIVNEPLRIGTVVASVLLVEQDDGVVRINFRSKAPDPQGVRPDVDVASLAKAFGGGGHRHAAGARSKLPVDHIQKEIVAKFGATLT